MIRTSTSMLTLKILSPKRRIVLDAAPSGNTYIQHIKFNNPLLNTIKPATNKYK
jgi:hypothetical protein